MIVVALLVYPLCDVIPLGRSLCGGIKRGTYCQASEDFPALNETQPGGKEVTATGTAAPPSNGVTEPMWQKMTDKTRRKPH